MTNSTIITCALTGAGDTTGINPHVPVTPEQIANEALKARDAGAAIVHIHVRDPSTGRSSRDPSYYREVVKRIREAGSDVIINLTTGVGARFVPSKEDANHNASQGMYSPRERIEHVLELKPDICSLDVATLNFASYAFINVPQEIEEIAVAVRAAGVKPELEMFELGHITLAKSLHKKKLFTEPLWAQLCLGIQWGAPATGEAMSLMKGMLPPGSNWGAFAVGASQFDIAAMSVLMGGHVRVGLEDNLYLRKGELAEGNAPLVRRAVAIVEALDRQVATPEQARNILQLG